MKLHVDICHVSRILPRSSLLYVRLRIRLIVSVLSPIHDRSCLTETPRSLDTKLVPPIRPSLFIILETFHLRERFCLKVTGIVPRLRLQTLLEPLLLFHQLLTEL